MAKGKHTHCCSLHRTQTDHVDADVITVNWTLIQSLYKIELAHFYLYTNRIRLHMDDLHAVIRLHNLFSPCDFVPSSCDISFEKSLSPCIISLLYTFCNAVVKPIVYF